MIKSENKFFIYDKPLKIDYKYYLKRILIPFYDILFHILILFINKKNIKKKYSVSICAIFKNEAHNFKEWIEFHKIVGVEHFYLYNNFSEDNYLEILKPYIENNIVTIVDWPFEGAQFTSYKHFYDNYKNETEWVSFLDLDEFITPL